MTDTWVLRATQISLAQTKCRRQNLPIPNCTCKTKIDILGLGLINEDQQMNFLVEDFDLVWI
jgi:hypothetical protein